ncbi:MAG TPA: DUF4446 family protein [Firmicutes bacterium]|jgi:hypothetical protein|nr:DUF4446 family protein [Bacillota bacterium]
MPLFGDLALPAVFQDRGVLLVILALLLLSLFLHLYLLRRVVLLNRRYKQLLGGLREGKSLEEILFTHLDNVQLALEQVGELELEYHKLEQNLKYCIQNLGVVRFNAFPDMGSDLSFAVALLDQGGDGVVLSSLYGRNESRIYAKPVQRGVSTYHLTDEERRAIQKALAKKQ